jgi:hypothetical protein
LRIAKRCKSIGLKPISHPPGVEIFAFFALPKIAPRKTTDERISLIKVSGISKPEADVLSTIKSVPRLSVLQPRFSRILIVHSTSERRGQLCIIDLPFTKYVAASIGNALFFEPCATKLPFNLLPPFITNEDITPHLSKSAIMLYSM